MIRLLFTLLFSLLLSFSTSADTQFKLQNTPEWVTQVEVPDSQTLSNHVDGQVYLLVDKQFNYLKEGDSKYFHYATKAISLQGVESISQISIDFDPSYERVVFHRLNVIRDGLAINKSEDVEYKQLKREVDLDRLLYNGEESIYLILKDIRVGDVLDYSFSIIGTNPVFSELTDNRISAGWSVPVSRTYIEIQYPQKSDIRVTVEGDADLSLNTSSANGVSKVIYSAGQTVYKFNEDNQPGWYAPYPSLRVNNIAGWSGVVDWALPLYQSETEDKPLSDTLKRVTSVKDKEQQIIKAIRIAQEQIRYLGIENSIGSHAPRKPGQVLEQGYGDCKDKALLLVSLLRSIDIEAYPALVDTYYRHTLVDKTPGYSVFNHVIVYFEYNGQPYWVDATKELQSDRLDTLTAPDLDYGLIIREGNDQLAKIESDNKGEIDSETDLEINKSGLSRMTVRTKYSGSEADRMRRYIVSNSQESISEEYEEYYTKMYPDIYADEPIRIEDDRSNNVISMEEVYVVENIWEEVDENRREALIFGDMISAYINSPKKKKRRTPFNLGSSIKVQQTLNIVTDESFTIEDENTEMTTDAFDYRFEVVSDGGVLDKLVSSSTQKFSIHYLYDQKQQFITKDKYRRYLKDVDKMEESLSYMLSVTD